MHAVTHFFAHASPLLIYGVVAVVLALESCGVPIANSTLLLLTGALASMGHANIWTLGVVAICGSIFGANMAYLIGVRGGRSVLLSVTQRFHIDPKQVEVAERWFQRSGVWMVFASRIVPYVRPFSCFPAGIARTPFPRFFASASLGSVIWCSAILYVGWSLGNRWGLALAVIRDYAVPCAGGVILLLVIYCLVMYHVKKTLKKRLSPPTKGPRVTRPLHDRDLIQHA
jgi:membrane protein DedA with SNARE-associated domain